MVLTMMTDKAWLARLCSKKKKVVWGCLGEVYVNSLNFVFVLWWLFFALCHVKAQRTVQVSEALESAGGMWNWLDTTIVVDKVYYG